MSTSAGRVEDLPAAPRVASLPGPAAETRAALVRQIRLSLKRWRRPAAALGLYFLLALALISPLVSGIIPDTASQDLANHVAGIIEARNALAEGQFPLRVSPKQCGLERYPTFQFYGNFPYTAGGLLYRYVGVRPYLAYKVLLVLALVAAAFYTYRCALLLTGATNPSVLAGAIFVTAPYMLTDIHARAAFTETVAFNLLPVVLFYALRSFERRPAAVLLSSATWSFLALSHNITYFYGSFFFCLYFLLHALWRRRQLTGLLCVGAGYALGLALTAWYIAPQLAVLGQLHVGRDDWANCMMGMSWLTPFAVLTAPALVLPRPYPVLDNPRFGLQVGWPILGGLWLTVRYLTSAGLPPAWRAGILRLLLLFGIAFFLVWTPFDVWHHLPAIFSFAQFSYRLLMFCVLFGSLLAGYAVAHWFRRGMRTEHMLVAVLGLGLFTSPYLTPTYTATGKVSEDVEIIQPDMGRGGNNSNYALSPEALARTALAPSVNSAGVVGIARTRPLTRYSRITMTRLALDESALVQLPVLYYPRLLEVRVDGKVAAYGNIDKYLALSVPAGEHAVTVGFVGLRWANRLSRTAWLVLLLGLPVCAGLAIRSRIRRPVLGIIPSSVSP